MHTLQFLINNSNRSPLEHWLTRKVANRWIHSCSKLPVKQDRTRDGLPVTLVGLAIQQESHKAPPEVLLSRCSGAELCREYRSWTGRWILIIDDELHMDASGNLNVFYTSSCDGLVSSSLELIRQLAGWAAPTNEIFHSIGIDWYVAPATSMKEVSQLLPSQVLLLDRLEVSRRDLVFDGDCKETPAALIASVLVTSLQNLKFHHKNFYLPLTAGLDSRTLLSACLAAGVRPITYTFDNPYMRESDHRVPREIAKFIGLEHRMVLPGQFSFERQEAFDRHTCSRCMDMDRRYYGRGQWQDWAQDGIILRGGCWEFGRAFYYHIIPGDFDIESPAAVDQLHCLLSRHSPAGRSWIMKRQPTLRRGLCHWVGWIRQSPESGLGFRDRFYLEQRLGSWLSSIEQALDLTGCRRLHLANSHLTFSLLNRVPLDERRPGTVQKRIIQQLVPELMKYEFNQPDGASVRTKKTIRKMFSFASILIFNNTRNLHQQLRAGKSKPLDAVKVLFR